MSKNKRKHEKILFVGNGINRLSDDISWENLMKDLAGEATRDGKLEFQDKKPFTLLYEEITFKMLDKKGKNASLREVETDLKRKIADRVKNLNVSNFYNTLLKLESTHILTTNYDYSIERSYVENNGEKANLSREVKYNLFRRRKIGDRFVWHIHGEAENPSSITLGYDHYTGQLQKMRNYFAEGIPSRRKGQSEERLKSIAKGLKSYEEFEESLEKAIRERKPFSWIDLFLGYDVHIIGFFLEYSEIDLWWLMVYKEKARRKNNWLGQTYYYSIKNGQNEKYKVKNSLLSSYGVQVKTYEVKENKSYQSAYEEIINDISGL